ncbi:MAG: 3-hydroxyacyl-CoA dehydrogenase family protein, partial [Candidatus Heimdallarchaeaceae archaeon]
MTEEFTKIAVVGAGTMGAGIAQVLATKGLDVALVDVKQEFLDNGLKKIEKILSRNVEKGRMTEEEKQSILNRIHPTLDLEKATEDVQLVIEAIIENEELKKELFSKLDNYCSSDVILASNTSAISISTLASVTKRPDKVLGMHFFNPPAIMKLVEIIKGKETSEETVNEVIKLCEKLGKVPVPSNEAPGFIVNRLLWQFLNEAYILLEE